MIESADAVDERDRRDGPRADVDVVPGHGDVHDVGVTTALLSAAANGLRNLALTYANDVATAAGIHALVELIGYHLQNMHQK